MSRETEDWLWVERAESGDGGLPSLLLPFFFFLLFSSSFFEAEDAAEETESSSTRLHPLSTYTAAGGKLQ